MFSTPYKVFIKVTDHYHLEKYCFKNQLTHVVDEFMSDIRYTDEQLFQLQEIVRELESCKKRFASKIDFAALKKSFALALDLLADDTREKELSASAPVRGELPPKDQPVSLKPRESFWKTLGQIAASAAVFTLAAATVAIVGTKHIPV